MAFENFSGQMVGNYRLMEELGRGGMGVVYRGYQAEIDRSVAIKLLLIGSAAPQAEYLVRFRREAKVLERLRYKYIVPLYDYGETSGRPYMVMPLLTGGSLALRIRRAPLAVPEAVRILMPIAEALEHAHNKKILHRDVKPSNVLFDDQGQSYLSDFGIAHLQDSQFALTADGRSIGTPAYMSPEQTRGDRNLDRRSDVYALGVVAYEALTSGLPFEADTPMGQSVQRNTQPPRPPRQLCPDLSEAVEAVILRALASAPQDRYSSAVDLARALQEASGGVPSPVNDSREGDTLLDSPSPMTLKSETHNAAEVCAVCGKSLAGLPRGQPCPVCGGIRIIKK